MTMLLQSFPGGSDSKESTCQNRRPGFDPWVGKTPWGGNSNPLQYSCLRIPWTEKPRGLQSVGLPRVRHDLASEPDHKVQQPLWQPGLRRGVGTVHTAQKTAVLAQVSGLWTHSTAISRRLWREEAQPQGRQGSQLSL